MNGWIEMQGMNIKDVYRVGYGSGWLDFEQHSTAVSPEGFLEGYDTNLWVGFNANYLGGKDLAWMTNNLASANSLAILSLKHDVATNKLETVFGWGDWKLGGIIYNAVRILNRFVIANDPASATTIGPNDSSFRLDFIRRLIGSGSYATSSINAASGGWLNRWDGDTSYKIYDAGTLVDPLVASGNLYAQIDTVHALNQIVAADTNVDVEKVVNGDFDYDGAWVYTNARYSSGTVILPITNYIAASATPTGNPWVPEVGQMYRVRADATLGGGGANYLPYVSLGGVTSQFATVVGNPKTVYIIPKTAQPLRFFYPSGFGGASNSLDNVSVRRMSGSSFYVSPTELLVRNADRNLLRVDADGLRMGDASFHAEPSGDIWHDSTNTAVLGILSASSIKNTNGVSVLYEGQAPTINEFNAATQLLADVAADTQADITALETSVLTRADAAATYATTGALADAQADIAVLETGALTRVDAVAAYATTGALADAQADIAVLETGALTRVDAAAAYATTGALASAQAGIAVMETGALTRVDAAAAYATTGALADAQADIAVLETGALTRVDAAATYATTGALADAQADITVLETGALTRADAATTYAPTGDVAAADAAISALIASANALISNLWYAVSNTVDAARLGGSLPTAFYYLADFQAEMTNRMRRVSDVVTSNTAPGDITWMELVPIGGGTNELRLWGPHALGTNTPGWTTFRSVP
jgi:hypothetical protein